MGSEAYDGLTPYDGLTEEEGEVDAPGAVSTVLLNAAVTIDHVAESFQQTHSLSDETTEEIKFRILAALAALFIVLSILAFCSCRAVVRLVRRRAVGYRKALTGDEHADNLSDISDNSSHTYVTDKVNALLEARLKGELVDNDLDRDAIRQKVSDRTQHIGTLPWGRIQLAEHDDGLPAKAIRPDKSTRPDKTRDKHCALQLLESKDLKPKADPVLLPVGTEVILLRLEQMRNFNGKLGIIRKYDAETQRYFVEVSTGDRLVLKQENIMPSDFDDASTSIAPSGDVDRTNHGFHSDPLSPARPESEERVDLHERQSDHQSHRPDTLKAVSDGWPRRQPRARKVSAAVDQEFEAGEREHEKQQHQPGMVEYAEETDDARATSHEGESQGSSANLSDDDAVQNVASYDDIDFRPPLDRRQQLPAKADDFDIHVPYRSRRPLGARCSRKDGDDDAETSPDSGESEHEVGSHASAEDVWSDDDAIHRKDKFDLSMDS